MRRVLLLLPLLLASGCERLAQDRIPSDEDRAPDVEVPVLVGEVALTLEPSPEWTPDTGARVAGLARDGEGRIVVVEEGAGGIRVHSAAGDFLFFVGRPGAGAGQYRDPCCPAAGPDGRLWVRDRGHGRYLAYTLGEDGAPFDRALPMADGDGPRPAVITFDGEGRLVDVAREMDPDTGEERVLRLHLEPDGTPGHREVIPVPPPESLGSARVETELATLVIHPPFGPRHLVAHAPGGGWATAVSSRYALEWRFPDGDGVTIRGLDGPGPPVTPEERGWVEERLRAVTEGLGLELEELGLAVPDRKPVLDEIFFDQEGRLWVSLLVPDGAPREAHVYGPDGVRLAAVRWPAGISLAPEGVTGTEALGTARDGERGDRAVLLRFREGVPEGEGFRKGVSE